MTHLSVPKIHCEECAKSIRKRLLRIDGVTGITFNMDARVVTVQGGPAAPDLIAALDEIGFPATRIG